MTDFLLELCYQFLLSAVMYSDGSMTMSVKADSITEFSDFMVTKQRQSVVYGVMNNAVHARRQFRCSPRTAALYKRPTIRRLEIFIPVADRMVHRPSHNSSHSTMHTVSGHARYLAL